MYDSSMTFWGNYYTVILLLPVTLVKVIHVLLLVVNCYKCWLF